MEDDFLRDYMIVYIEKEIAKTLKIDTIIEHFNNMEGKKTRIKWQGIIFS